MLLALVAIATVIGCSSESGQPTGRAMSIDDAAATLARLSGRPLRPFSTRDFGRDQNSAARSVLVGENDAP
jgi:hypothetical protein